MLARQALEEAVDARWAAVTGDRADAASDHAVSAHLPSRLPGLRAVARQVAFTYAALTSACHYHPYELAPTAAELTSWIADAGPSSASWDKQPRLPDSRRPS